MKKIVAVVAIFLIVLGGVEKENSFSLLNYFSGEYTVYTSTDNDKNGVNLGFCYMNSFPVNENVIGESMVIENLEISSALETLCARVIKTEYLDNGTIVIYAYSTLIEENRNIFGQKINLQIATQNEVSVIGWPLILGSF